MTFPFLIFAALTLAGATAAMTQRKLVHCALALAASFAGLGAVYLTLSAEFAGLVQLLVYVGAIAVLIVFAILLTRGADADTPRATVAAWFTAGAVAAAVFAVLSWAVLTSSVTRIGSPAAPDVTIRQIGETLMERFTLPLEVLGLLLTAAMIGAVILALEEKPSVR